MELYFKIFLFFIFIIALFAPYLIAVCEHTSLVGERKIRTEKKSKLVMLNTLE